MSDDWQNRYFGRVIYRPAHTRSAAMADWQAEQTRGARQTADRAADEWRGVREKYARSEEQRPPERWEDLIAEFGLATVVKVLRHANPDFELPDHLGAPPRTTTRKAPKRGEINADRHDRHLRHARTAG